MKLNIKTKMYLSFLSILAVIIYIFLLNTYKITDYQILIFWSILSVIVESLLILLPNNSVGVSVGYAITISTVIVGGPLLSSTTYFIGILCRIPRVKDRGYVHIFNTPLYKIVYNLSQCIIVPSVISYVYLATGGTFGQFSLIPTLCIVLLGVAINTFILSGFLTFFNDQNFFKIWLSNIKGTFPSSIAVGTMGIIVALAFIGYGYGAVILFFGPLLLARYSFKLYIEMRNLYLSTIQALNKSLEAKDPYTSGHAARVEKFAVELAEAYNLPFESIQNIKTAAILHDIGKIGINDSILNKASRLTMEEYQEIMRHPSIGAEIISKVDFLKHITGIIKHHHERYDGKGYPDGLLGEQIPIEACVLVIADSYDAMTTDRPYRKALTKEEAIEEIRRNAGTQFHPALAEKFIALISQ